MKFIFKEWLQDKKACMMLLCWFICNLVTVVISNYLVIMISNIFGDIENWINHLITLVFVLITNIIASSLVGYLRTASIKQVYTTLINRYVDKILGAEYKMFTKYSVARINTAQEFLSKISSIGMNTGAFIIRCCAIIITLFTMYQIGGDMIIPIIIIYFIGMIIFSKVYKEYMKIDEAFTVVKRKRNQEVENIINGFAEVRSFNTVEEHRISIRNKNQEICGNQIKKAKINSILYGSIDGVEAVGLIIVIGYTIYQLSLEALNQAQAMSLIMLVFKLMDPMLAILDFISDISDNMSLKDEYKNIIEYPGLMRDGSVELLEFKDEINLKNVTFSYDNSNNTLAGVNMKIKKGQKIGICGTSGGGKSTLFKLLNRFYDHKGGEITIDGVPLNEITLDSYRKHVGSVHQENIIFPGTIKENIMYGSSHATENELLDACNKAHILEFILSLDKKFDTEVGPRGLKLSGGQKQRISLARLFLKNPEIILLDEATSALDNESETIIQDAVDALEGKTIITIAHRLSTIQNCDIIYVIQNGTVVESGSHQELVEKHGVYYNMLK